MSKKSVKRVFLPLDPDVQPRVTKMILESDRIVVEAEMPMKEDSPMLGRIMSGIPVNMSMVGLATVKDIELSWLKRVWRWIMTKVFRRKLKKKPQMVVDLQATHLEFDLSNSYRNLSKPQIGDEHDVQEDNQSVTDVA